MLLDTIFEPFLRASPLSVMARATVEHAFSASALDELFERTAERGYTKELLFSTTVELMSLVVGGKAVHVQAAFLQMREKIPVSLKSVYEKLQKIETGVSAGLVSHIAGRCEPLVAALGGGRTPILPGYRTRILDGNHLAATQKRLKVTRGRTAGPLPGQCLAILDPDSGLMTDVIPCEDAHVQERALIRHVFPRMNEGDLWIADRNFCTTEFLTEAAERGARVVVRRHGNLTVEPACDVEVNGSADFEGYGAEAETERGWVSERQVWICREGVRIRTMREVCVRLRKPTEDGEKIIEILTDLPADVSAVRVAEIYLSRWRVEGAFHELTVALHCETNTLGYPRAALFGFCVAVCAFNVLSVLKAALRSVHGEKKVQEEVSGYYMALELAMVLQGMMIALPGPKWEVFGRMSTDEMARHLRDWAGRINLSRVKKSSPRKPTKVKSPRIKGRSPHVSTARLLEEAKRVRRKK